MVVVFDIIFCGYYYFKLNRKETMLFDIANICFTVMYVRSLNYIFAAINVFTWKQKEAVCLISYFVVL